MPKIQRIEHHAQKVRRIVLLRRQLKGYIAKILCKRQLFYIVSQAEKALYALGLFYYVAVLSFVKRQFGIAQKPRCRLLLLLNFLAPLTNARNTPRLSVSTVTSLSFSPIFCSFKISPFTFTPIAFALFG